ncbi:hypothetical protein [Candidatus Regiella insecticola]|uniref:hypothetical protein n=1 Tax=Candidatus Regiella insecticola TaxID=138073 RepID=UPI001596C858|nr:hypothetical protein [Candidatus Regiella insecticola]
MTGIYGFMGRFMPNAVDHNDTVANSIFNELLNTEKVSEVPEASASPMQLNLKEMLPVSANLAKANNIIDLVTGVTKLVTGAVNKMISMA